MENKLPEKKTVTSLWNAGFNECHDAFTPHIAKLTQERDALLKRVGELEGRRRDQEKITHDDLRGEEIDAILKAQADAFGYVKREELQGREGLEEVKRFLEETKKSLPFLYQRAGVYPTENEYTKKLDKAIAICARFSAPGGLVPLSEDAVRKFLFANSDGIYTVDNARDVAKTICQRFGVPKVPTVEEMARAAYKQHMMNATVEGKWDINLTDIGKEHWLLVGQAVRDLLNKGEK